MSSNVRCVRVRWFGNGSRRYDCKKDDVEVDAIIEEDHVDLAVGRPVRMPWGCGEEQCLWTATVVELLQDPTPLELALPAQHKWKLPVLHPTGTYCTYINIYYST